MVFRFAAEQEGQLQPPVTLRYNQEPLESSSLFLTDSGGCTQIITHADGWVFLREGKGK